jgi:hypothetical protein
MPNMPRVLRAAQGVGGSEEMKSTEYSCLDCDGECDTTGECKHGGEE